MYVKILYKSYIFLHGIGDIMKSDIIKSNNGIFRQRVGLLIEESICKKFKLFYNKRQRTQGYYDAYINEDIYEIKGSNLKYNTFIIRVSNHEKLLESAGSYIFVSYELKNKDKDLSVITDILLSKIYIIPAKDVDKKLKKYGLFTNSKRKIKVCKIQLTYIETIKGIKNIV